MKARAKTSAAAIAILAGMGMAMSSGALAREAGVTAAVNADSTTLPPLQDEQTLVVGHNVVFNEKITTGELGQAQLLMLDQSAVTVAQNSELIIDKFVYDPDKRTGEMALSLSRGLMRFVGGRLSKTGNTTIRTPVATMGIRGGIVLINVISATSVDVTLLYGEAIKGQTDTGQNFTVRRHGYFTRIEAGQGATPPQPIGSGAVAESMAKLEGRSTSTAGAPEAPTDEGAENNLGGPPPPQEAPPTNDGLNAKKAPDTNGGDNDGPPPPPERPPESIVDDLPDPVDESFVAVTLTQLGLSGIFQDGEIIGAIGERVLIEDPQAGDSTSLASGGGTGLIFGFDPDNFDPGDELFVLQSVDTGEALVSFVNGGPLEFSLGGVGDPDDVPNIFDTADPNRYVSPGTFNAGADRPFEGLNVSGVDWFAYDLTTSDFDGVNGARFTPFSGATFANPGGQRFYDVAGDTTNQSFLPYSDIGNYEVDRIGGGANGRLINPANVGQTPLIVDFDKGKFLQISTVFDQANPNGAVYGIQAMAGDLQNQADTVLLAGSNAGSSHFSDEGVDSRSFSSGVAAGVPVGDPTGADTGVFLFGGHETIQPLDAQGNRVDPVETINFQVGQETTPIALDTGASDIVNGQIFAGTLVIEDDGFGNIITEVLATENTDIGTLDANAAQGEIQTTFLVNDEVGDTIEVTSQTQNGAFFDNDAFAVVQPAGANGVGLVMVAGEQAVLPNKCTCAFMAWGFWAGAENLPGDPSNAVTDVGAFFGGVATPTIDMPISGQAEYNGRAYASMITPGDAAPTFAQGAFQLRTNFATGLSAGDMSLNAESFTVIGAHSPGQSALDVQYFQNAQQVGDGAGAFFGPAAANVGVTIDIDNGAGLQAGGAAIGER